MIEIQSQISLKEFAWWKVGGSAEHFCLPESIEQVQEAVQFAQANQLSITMLGGGTNVLIHDQGVKGLVICMRKLVGTSVVEINGRLAVEALAGTPKSELMKIYMRRKLAPALFLCGLPGDVGGGVVMNAGVAEKIAPREFVDMTDWVDVLDLNSATQEVRRFQRGELIWSYRALIGWQPGIVVRAAFSWPLEVDDEIPRKVKDATKSRIARQPLELPSCGSTFKNPQGQFAGALIEKAGLKGFQIGGAQVSPKHANFIVNIGEATAADIYSVICHVQGEVKKQFGVDLETEIKWLGPWS